MRDKKIDPGLAKVKEAFDSDEELAHAIGITKQAVNQWTKVPLKRVLEVERVSGVPRHVIRPDFYPSMRAQMSLA